MSHIFFQQPIYEEWIKTAETSLKGKPFDTLKYHTYEGFTIDPLYTPDKTASETYAPSLPGWFPFIRGTQKTIKRHGWDICQRHTYPECKEANAKILQDVRHDVTTILLRFDEAVRRGYGLGQTPKEQIAQDGIMIYDLDDLAQVLRDVPVSIRVALDGGAHFLEAACLLMAFWQEYHPDRNTLCASLNADPLGALIQYGWLPVSLSTALENLADLAKYTAQTYPNVIAITVDTSVYHNAGADEALDLACSMSTALLYIQTLCQAGMSIDEACRQIAFTYSIGCDQFLSLAKLRAARHLWARITQACNVQEESAKALRMTVKTADNVLTKHAPWTNVLRNTLTCFVAATSGADTILLQHFDTLLGPSNELAQRLTRNIHHVLREESGLAWLLDPSGGAWYVENLTHTIAQTAWKHFQSIQAQGGLISVLKNHTLFQSIAQTYQQKRKDITTRKQQITNVSVFPHIYDPLLKRPLPEVGDLIQQKQKKHTQKSPVSLDTTPLNQGQRTPQIISCFRQATPIGHITYPSTEPPITIKPLPQYRLSQPYEILRDASDLAFQKNGVRLCIFVAQLGPVAQYSERVSFTKMFFEIGGIEPLAADSFEDVQVCVDAFRKAQTPLAVLCSSDHLYQNLVEQFAPPLKAAGCTSLFLAGYPKEKRQTYQELGIDHFIFLGCDVFDILYKTLCHCEVIKT